MSIASQTKSSLERTFRLIYYSTPFYLMTYPEAICTYLTLQLLFSLVIIGVSKYVVPVLLGMLEVAFYVFYSESTKRLQGLATTSLGHVIGNLN